MNNAEDSCFYNPLKLSKLFHLWNRDIDTPSGDSQFNLLTRIDSASALAKRLTPGWFSNSNTRADLSALLQELLQQLVRYHLKEYLIPFHSMPSLVLP